MTQEELEKEKADFEASLEGLSDEEKTQKIADKEKADELLKHNTEIEEALKKERELRQRAEASLEETRRKAKERFEKRKLEGEGEDDEDQPLTKKTVQELLESEREIIRKETRQEQALEIAKRISENESEANLVIEVWKNRTLQGTLTEQLQEAHAIATSNRIKAQNAELKRALSGNDTGDGLNTQRKPAPEGEPKIDPDDKTVYIGYTWDSARFARKKPIAFDQNGKPTKMLFVSGTFKDGKRKRWVEPIK